MVHLRIRAADRDQHACLHYVGEAPCFPVWGGVTDLHTQVEKYAQRMEKQLPMKIVLGPVRARPILTKTKSVSPAYRVRIATVARSRPVKWGRSAAQRQAEAPIWCCTMWGGTEKLLMMLLVGTYPSTTLADEHYAYRQPIG